MKSKSIVYLVLTIATISMISCTTSNYIVSNETNVDIYKYASISEVMGYTGSASLMDMDVLVYDIVSSSRLKMIGEREIDGFSEKEYLLLVKYSVSQSSEESVVSITFVDYLTLKPVATCRGAYGLGLGVNQDLQIAVRKAKEQVQLLFGEK